ncbi:MAG: hypothetical protein AAGU75_05725 [Bacillota bacterium]
MSRYKRSDSFWEQSIFEGSWYDDKSIVKMAANQLAVEADIFGPINFTLETGNRRLAVEALVSFENADPASTAWNLESGLFDLGLDTDTLSLDANDIKALEERHYGTFHLFNRGTGLIAQGL